MSWLLFVMHVDPFCVPIVYCLFTLKIEKLLKNRIRKKGNPKKTKVNTNEFDVRPKTLKILSLMSNLNSNWQFIICNVCIQSYRSLDAVLHFCCICWISWFLFVMLILSVFPVSIVCLLLELRNRWKLRDQTKCKWMLKTRRILMK